MQADRDAFHNLIWATVRRYELDHGYEPSTKAISQLVSTNLYYRRFFPYYTFNIVAGLDEEGNGAVYGYDAVGSFQRVGYGAQGSGSALATSVLDNQVNFESQPKNKRDIGLEEALELIRDSFTSVGERDIYTGDAVDIFIITKDGTQHELFPLKAD
jgi:20S proteasome subunit beta 6